MGQAAFFFVLCIIVSILVQAARRFPVRGMFRRHLWVFARSFGLEKSHLPAQSSRLVFEGERKGLQFVVASALEERPEKPVFSVHLTCQRPLLVNLVFEYPTDSSPGERSLCESAMASKEELDFLCLSVPMRRSLLALMHGDRVMRVQGKSILFVDHNLQLSDEDMGVLVSEVVEWVASYEALWSEPEQTVTQLIKTARHSDFENVQLRAFSLLVRLVREEVWDDAILWDLLKEQDADWLQYAFYRAVVEGFPREHSLVAFVLERAFASESRRLQMLAAVHMGEEGYARLHELSASSDVPESIRVEALHHLLEAFPYDEEKLRRLLSRALKSEHVRLNRTALSYVFSRQLGSWKKRIRQTETFLDILNRQVRFSSVRELKLLVGDMLVLLERPFAEWESSWLGSSGLVELLRHRTSSTLRPVFRWLERVKLSASEDLLLAWVRHPDREFAHHVVGLLGQVGTLRAVAPLKHLTRGMLGTNSLKRAVGRAILLIEERSADVAVGHLSLLEGMAGRGALSRALGRGFLSVLEQSGTPDGDARLYAVYRRYSRSRFVRYVHFVQNRPK